jgi:hypothetical protein
MTGIFHRPDGSRRIGTKGVFALALGGLAAARGLGYVSPTDVPDGLSTLHSILPLDLWGWVWVLAGAAAIIGGFVHRENVAFVGIAVVNSVWAVSYAYEWMHTMHVTAAEWTVLPWWDWTTLPWVAVESSRGWITAVSYATQVIAILVVVRLIDPVYLERSRAAPGGEDA